MSSLLTKKGKSKAEAGDKLQGVQGEMDVPTSVSHSFDGIYNENLNLDAP